MAETQKRIDLRNVLPTQSQVFFFGILALMFFLTWKLFQPFLIYIVTGMLVAILAFPLDRAWEKILPNRIAAFATLFSVFLILTIPVVALGFSLANDAEKAVAAIQAGKLEDFIADINDFLAPFLVNIDEAERATFLQDTFTEQIQPWLLQQAQTLAAKAGGFLLDLGIAITVILFVLYYVLTDGAKLANYLRRAAPLPATQVDYLMEEGHNGLKAVFYGQILTSLIQGGLGGIGFLIAGVPGAIIWAAVMAILSLLPVIGPPVVWIPAAVYLLISGDIWQGIFLIAWGAIVVAQVDNFVRPKLIGDRADIHPLFVLIGVLGGVAAFGFIGLFLGPLLVGITVSVLKVWESDYLDPRLAGQEPKLNEDDHRADAEPA